MKIVIEQIKPVLGDVNKNLSIMLQSIDKAIENENDLIIFPELSLNGNLLKDIVFDTYIEKIPQELLKKSNEISILFGGIELADDFLLYNTAFYLEDGKEIFKHRKINELSSNLANGNELKSFETKFGKLGVLIGEDVFNMGYHHILASDNLHYLFVISAFTADMDNSNIRNAENLKTILKTSSICNSIYTILCNRVGIEDGLTYFGGSFVIDPFGNILKESKLLEEDTINLNISKKNIIRSRISNKILTKFNG